MTITASSVALPWEELRQRLGNKLITNEEDVAAYATDSSRAVPNGLPTGVVVARSTQDVVEALKWASAHKIPVSVRGSGTGLAGGATAYADGLVISLAALTSIISIDPANRIAEVQAGVITADIDAAAAKYGLMYAPDPASYRQSTIGGNIATNAGGLRCVKFGVTGDSIAGLEVVLANGDTIQTGARTRKNVAGYDLTSLFVGSEGTLGVITAALVRLQPRPQGDALTFRASFSALESAGHAVTSIMGIVVPDVMELMDSESVKIVERFAPTGLDFLTTAAVLIGQFIGAKAHADVETARQLCEAAGAIDVSVSTGDALLEARRVTSRALSAEGLRVSSDVAVPVSRLAEMFAAIHRIGEQEGVSVPTFAHAGDGNLHPSVIVNGDSPSALAHGEKVLDLISDAALAFGGTLSGEHGIGSLKRSSLPKQLSVTTLAAHRLVKQAFDPTGILSPGRGI